MSAETAAPWYRQFWCWFVLGPPIASVILSALLVGIATTQGDSLVRDDYEKVGRAIHKTYAQEAAAAERGVTAQMVLDRARGHVTLRLDGLESPPARLRLSLSHPTHAERDRLVELRRDDSGVYRGGVSEAVTGRYYLRLEPVDGDWLLASEIGAGAQELSLVPRSRGG